MRGYRTSKDYSALERIAWLLLGLAALAECACTRSPAVRLFVLLMLRPAERVASAFVGRGIGPVRIYALPELMTDEHSGHCAEAMRLAFRFRVLAMVVGIMLRQLIAGRQAETQHRLGADILFRIHWLANRAFHVAVGRPAGRARDRPGILIGTC